MSTESTPLIAPSPTSAGIVSSFNAENLPPVVQEYIGVCQFYGIVTNSGVLTTLRCALFCLVRERRAEMESGLCGIDSPLLLVRYCFLLACSYTCRNATAMLFQ